MRLGVNLRTTPGVASMFVSPQRLFAEMLDLGIDGTQILPMKGMDFGEICRIARQRDALLLFEDAWNAVPGFWYSIKHLRGAAGMTSTIKDWVVSPRPEACDEMVSQMARHGLTQVCHNFKSVTDPERQFVEVSPRLCLNASELVERCLATGIKLVIDSKHIIGLPPDRTIPVRAIGRNYAEKQFRYCKDIVQYLANNGVLAPIFHLNSTGTETEIGIPMLGYRGAYLLDRWCSFWPDEVEKLVVLEFSPKLWPARASRQRIIDLVQMTRQGLVPDC
ncbi:MAG TPA: hypothetical protein VJK08_03465 [Patescibacteria group bacterium]|nr:hypothetical protein [Patescibacteria group bacterium]